MLGDSSYHESAPSAGVLSADILVVARRTVSSARTRIVMVVAVMSAIAIKAIIAAVVGMMAIIYVGCTVTARICCCCRRRHVGPLPYS